MNSFSSLLIRMPTLVCSDAQEGVKEQHVRQGLIRMQARQGLTRMCQHRRTAAKAMSMTAGYTGGCQGKPPCLRCCAGRRHQTSAIKNGGAVWQARQWLTVNTCLGGDAWQADTGLC